MPDDETLFEEIFDGVAGALSVVKLLGASEATVVPFPFMAMIFQKYVVPEASEL